MSYYVLTSTSNLGNILSTETISPASIYAMRRYGYRFFDRYGDDIADDHIRLHYELPTPVEEGEGAVAMALELDESLVKHAVGNAEGSLWTTETIRLSPANCKFIFFTGEDLNTAFNGVQRNLEAKFAVRYRTRAQVLTPEKPEGTLFDELEQTKPSLDNASIEDIGRYERMDRIKGAIFGYCLGFYYSLPKNNLVRDDLVRYLTTVDSMVNSVTLATAEELEGYRSTIERILFRFILHGEAKRLKQMEVDGVESFDMNVELNRIRNLSCVESPLAVRNDTFGLSFYRSDLEDRIRKAKDEWRRPTPFKSEDKPSVTMAQSGPRLQLPPKDGGLATHLINYLIRTDVLSRTNRKLGYDFALDCGKILKRYIGERWEDSGERNYINKLLPHLNTLEDFDPNDGTGIEDEGNLAALKAIAYLCEKQDNEDLDSFYQYLLLKCQVADFCLPFALWGAAFGFSTMPKTLCDSMSKPTEDTARALFDSVLTVLEEQDG